MISNQLINFFDSLIHQNEENLEKEHERIFGSLERLKEKVIAIIENPNIISELNLDDLSKHVAINEDLMKKIKFYQVSSKSTIFPLTEQQKAGIVTIFLEFKRQIEQRLEEFVKNNEEYQLLKNNHQNILDLFHKLVDGEILTKDEFIKISKIIKENSNNINEALTLLKNLAINVSLQYEKESKLEKEAIVKINNLNRDEVVNLFSQYSLDFEQFKDRDKDQLLLYGNLDNIKDILTVFKENKIRLDILSYSKQISQILILSNEKNINIIFGKIKEDLGDLASDEYHFNRVFDMYMAIPSVFISGLKRYERHSNSKTKSKKTNSHTDNDFFPGALDNYLLNRQFFLDLGIKDINKAIEKCSSIFTSSHRKIRTNLEYFKSYGIDSSVFLNTLSSMRATNPLDVIDQFIEADAYDYIINCFSKTTLSLNSPSLYQLINAKKHSWPDTEIYRYKRIGNKKQKQLRTTNLNKLSGSELEKESQYKIETDLDYENIDFSNQEPITDIVLNNYFIRNLENNFKHDELTYNFNGIIISRYKVLRYYAILLHNHMGGLKSLKYAIFKNKIMTKTEYDMINDCLNTIFNKKSTKETQVVNSETTLNLLVESNNPSNSSIPVSKSHQLIEDLSSNYFIKFLDDNFIKNNFPHEYNFNGIGISRYWTIKEFSVILATGEVTIHPLYALYKAINLAYKARHKRNIPSDQAKIIKDCLNEASEYTKDMGIRL